MFIALLVGCLFLVLRFEVRKLHIVKSESVVKAHEIGFGLESNYM